MSQHLKAIENISAGTEATKWANSKAVQDWCDQARLEREREELMILEAPRRR